MPALNRWDSHLPFQQQRHHTQDLICCNVSQEGTREPFWMWSCASVDAEREKIGQELMIGDEVVRSPPLRLS